MREFDLIPNKLRLPRITIPRPRLLSGSLGVVGRQLALASMLVLSACSGKDLPVIKATPHSPTEKKGASSTDDLRLIFDGNYLTQSLHNALGGKEGVLSSLDIAPQRVVSCEPGQKATIDESPVRAPLTGRVIKVGDVKNQQDPDHSLVAIQAENGEAVALVHLDEIPTSIQVGELVEAGTVIGVPSCESPPGGSTDGVHVHQTYLGIGGNPMSPVGKKIGDYTIQADGTLVSAQGIVIEGYSGRGDLDGSRKSNRLDIPTPKPVSQPPALAAPKPPIDQVETINKQPVSTPTPDVNSMIATQVSERVATALAATATPRPTPTLSTDSIIATQVSAQVATVLAGKELPSTARGRLTRTFPAESTEPAKQVAMDYDPKYWETVAVTDEKDGLMFVSKEKVSGLSGIRPAARINVVPMHKSDSSDLSQLAERTTVFLKKNKYQVPGQPEYRTIGDGYEAVIVSGRYEVESLSARIVFFKDKKGALWEMRYTGELGSDKANNFLNEMMPGLKAGDEGVALSFQSSSTQTPVRIAPSPTREASRVTPTLNPEVAKRLAVRSKFIDFYQSLFNVNVGSIDDTFGRLVVSSTIKTIDKNSNSLNGVVYWQSIGPFSYYRGEGNFVVAGELEFQKGVLYFNPEDLSREERANGVTAKGWSGFDGLARYDARVTYVTKGQIPIETLRFNDSELNKKEWAENKIKFWTVEKDGQLQIVPSLRYYKDLVPTFTVPFQVIETSQYTAMGSDSMATRYEGVMASRIRARCRYPVWCNMPFHPDYVNPR
ncbi:MAG: M23 family metallopeptidase [Candidatus Daviesbacteria bacterium]|nr:M23 family metallopeptidase [Candidatus Daviesbacteria bacterium]